MREIQASQITEAIAKLCIEANCFLAEDICCALCRAEKKETFPAAQEILHILTNNQKIARRERMPICQDTGLAVVFAEIGQDVHLIGDFEDAVNAGVREGYVKGLLRKSVVGDPLRRVNTGDNTPAILHVRLMPGDRVRLTVAPKGAGSENMSQLKMLTPADGVEGVKRFVLQAVREAGANPCPPMILGVGIGGNLEQVGELAKRALLLPIGEHHPDPYYAALEDELLELVNRTGIGPQGLGGATTALGLHVLAAPTHIASLPVAVNIGCHVTRHQTIIL